MRMHIGKVKIPAVFGHKKVPLEKIEKKNQLPFTMVQILLETRVNEIYWWCTEPETLPKSRNVHHQNLIGGARAPPGPTPSTSLITGMIT